MKEHTSASLRHARRAGAQAIHADSRMLIGEFFARLLSSMGDAIRTIAADYAYEQRYRKSVRELQQMDDRTLQDIGITRGDIPHLVRNGRR